MLMSVTGETEVARAKRSWPAEYIPGLCSVRPVIQRPPPAPSGS